jgi:plasmid stability protein
MGWVKMTIDLPEALVTEVKLRAVREGRTVRDLVAEMLVAGLKGDGRWAVAEVAGEAEVVAVAPTGLPLIRCRSDAPAVAMTVPALLALEDAAMEQEAVDRGRRTA